MYLRAVEDEATIRAFHSRVQIPGASIKQLKARKEGTSEFWWMWQTRELDIDPANVDSGVLEFLRAHTQWFTGMKEAGPTADLYLELVFLLKDSDEPPGLYLSAETLALLADLGAQLDNDVVRDLS